MVALKVVFFVWAVSVVYESHVGCMLPVKTVAAVVTSLQERIHFGCAYVTYSGNEAEWLQKSRFLVEFRKGLRSNLQLGFLPDTHQTEFLHKCPSSPLLVVPDTQLLLQESHLKELLEKRQSEFTWLLLLDDGKTDDALSDVHIEFDSQFFVIFPSTNATVDILEAYRVANGYPLVIKKFCTWDHSTGLACTTESVRSRRNDLMGYEMKTGVVEFGFHSLRDIANIVSVAGVVIWYRLQKTTLYGSRSANGTWNGIVGRVASGELDVGLSTMMVTPSRHEVIDFSVPFFFTREHLYIREPEEEQFEWDGFRRPFDGRLCVCTFALMLVVWAVLRVHRRYTETGRNPLDGGRVYSDFLHVIGIFCMQGCATATRDSVRVSLLVASISALVVYTAYCGALTASLATHQPRLPFTDLKGLLQDGSYKLMLLRGSGEMTLFADSEESVTRQIYNNIVVKENMPVHPTQAFDRLCSTDKHAFLSHLVEFRLHEDSLKCTVTSTQEYISTQLAIAFKKRSPYREIINYHLLKLYTEGVVPRLIRKHWPLSAMGPQQLRQRQPRRVQSLRPVYIARVAPLLLVRGDTDHLGEYFR
ncbi:glutamate receptor ionotropic, kainate glr-3-like [Schistocerca serialis cubense]|uniref:glutamate receptor ionotropic, kainate glr-3-like n=1 Tax=Schistocerca serialis cubense TaxID=2023355 RepID=UPI00214EFF92|nr:glutamate receptor ionotropic, kainate glr-3-like [Schistocerca serialis cubense]